MMKTVYKILTIIFAVTVITVIGGFISGAFGQASPPSLPSPPKAVPWENFIITLAGCLSYGVFRIIRKK